MGASKLQFTKVSEGKKRDLFNRLYKEKVELRLWRPSDGEQEFKIIEKLEEEEQFIYFFLKDKKSWLDQKVSLFIKDGENEYLSSGKLKDDFKNSDYVGFSFQKLFLIDNRVDPRLSENDINRPLIVFEQKGSYRFKCKNISSTGAGIKVMKGLSSLFELEKVFSNATLIFNGESIHIPKVEVVHITPQKDESLLVGLKFDGLEKKVAEDLSLKILHLITEEN